MSFPTSPTNGQTTVVNNVTYQYTAATTAWKRVLSSVTSTTNLAITNSTVSTSTGTGALVVTGGAGIGGTVNIGGAATFAGNINSGHIIPTANVTYDLGSPTQRFRTLYISGNTIDMGGALITTSGGQVVFTSSLGGIATGVFANVTANSGAASTSTTTGALIITGGAGISGNLYVGGNLVVTGTTTFNNIETVTTTEYVNTINATNLYASTIGNTGATLTGTLSTAAQTNITSVGTLTSLAVGAVTSSGAIIASTVNAGTIGNSGATLTGTLSTASQTNITSVGTLTSLAVGAVTSSGTLIASTVSAGTIGNSGATLTGTLSTASQTNITAVGTITTGTWSGLFGAVSGANLTSLTAGNLTGTIPSAVLGASTVYVGTTAIALNRASASQSLTGISIDGSAATVTGAAQTAITSVGTLTSLTVSGTASAAKIVGGTNAGPTTASNYGLQASGSYGGGLSFTDGTGGIGIYSTNSGGNLNFAFGTAAGTMASVVNISSAGVYSGKATTAQYADLAENYTPDSEYAPGTVVVFGGSAEITVTTTSHDTAVAGIISTNPAYLMNSELEGLPVAMTGRVPCRVQGPVRKGQVLVTSTTAGVAQAIDNSQFVPGCVVGKALEAINTNTIETIEVVVGRF